MSNLAQAMEWNESVLVRTLKEENERGDWMKRWLMIQNFTALNTMYRKTLGKKTTCRSLRGTEKQIDYFLIKRRHLRYSKDAEANDMIHMGSDHRCVMATFVINAQKKKGTRGANNNKQRNVAKESIRGQIDKKNGNKEASTFKERYQELEERSNKKLQPQNPS